MLNNKKKNLNSFGLLLPLQSHLHKIFFQFMLLHSQFLFFLIELKLELGNLGLNLEIVIC